VLLRELTTEQQQDLDLWAGCASGALLVADYTARLTAAGFADVAITVAEPASGNDGKPWQSALINARKPGGVNAGKPWLAGGERIELIAPAGLETAACCDTSCCEPSDSC